MVFQTGQLYQLLLYLRYGEGNGLDIARDMGDTITHLFKELRMAQTNIDDTVQAIAADVNALRGMQQQLFDRVNTQATLLDQMEQARLALQARIQQLQGGDPQITLTNEQSQLTNIREQLDSLRADTQAALNNTPNTPPVTSPATTPTAADLGTPPPPVNNPPSFPPTGIPPEPPANPPDTAAPVPPQDQVPPNVTVPPPTPEPAPPPPSAP